MDEMIIIRAENAGLMHKNEHENYEYIKHELVPLRKGGQCKLNLYEIPPHKSAYPYHYHTLNEEVFYIFAGSWTA